MTTSYFIHCGKRDIPKAVQLHNVDLTAESFKLKQLDFLSRIAAYLVRLSGNVLLKFEHTMKIWQFLNKYINTRVIVYGTTEWQKKVHQPEFSLNVIQPLTTLLSFNHYLKGNWLSKVCKGLIDYAAEKFERKTNE